MTTSKHHDYHYQLEVKPQSSNPSFMLTQIIMHRHADIVQAECVRCFSSPFVVEMRGRRELDGAQWEEELISGKGETAAFIKRGINRLL